MRKFIYDSRWNGEHGIGRFSREVFEGLNNLEPIDLDGHPANPLDCFKLTAYLSKKKQFFFSPGYNSPLFFLNRTLITVHDLNHIDIDSNTSFLKKVYYNLVLKRACTKSYRVFTVSEFSKKRICEWSGVDPDRVIVVGNGVSNDFSTQGSAFESSKPYIFTVGNRKAHKNELLAIKAFAKSDLVNSHNYYFSGVSSPELDKIIQELNVKDKIFFAGRLSDQQLAEFYRGADALLFPSLYEGFGLPVIEAMSCGLPVITSNSTSLKEISGDAAILVNPSKVDEIVNALNVVCRNEELRSELIAKGLNQASKYSWSSTINMIARELNSL